MLGLSVYQDLLHVGTWARGSSGWGVLVEFFVSTF